MGCSGQTWGLLLTSTGAAQPDGRGRRERGRAHGRAARARCLRRGSWRAKCHASTLFGDTAPSGLLDDLKAQAALRTPARSLGILEARRGLSISPQRAPKIYDEFSYGVVVGDYPFRSRIQPSQARRPCAAAACSSETSRSSRECHPSKRWQRTSTGRSGGPAACDPQMVRRERREGLEHTGRS